MNLEDIKALLSGGELEAALVECNELLESDARNIDALRMRASINSLLKRYMVSLSDYQMIVRFSCSRIGDFYLAADAALLAQDYGQAIEWLAQVIDIGEQIRDDAFESAAYFLLAFARMQERTFDLALDSLGRAVAKDAGIALPLPGVPGLATARDLRAEIRRRALSN